MKPCGLPVDASLGLPKILIVNVRGHYASGCGDGIRAVSRVQVRRTPTAVSRSVSVTRCVTSCLTDRIFNSEDTIVAIVSIRGVVAQLVLLPKLVPVSIIGE